MTRSPLHARHTAAGASFDAAFDYEIPVDYGRPGREYEAARHAAGLLDRFDAGVVRLGGETRLDFLQRQSTNDLKPLRAGQATITVLTNPQARIIDTLTVLARDDDFLLLDGPPFHERLARHLRGLIFFMDKVTATDLNQEWTQLDLLGPEASVCLQAASGAEGPARFHWQDLSVAEQPVIVVRLPGPGSDELRLLTPPAAVEAVWDTLLAAGAQPVGRRAYDSLRVEFGLPAPGSELNDSVTPLEAGLHAYISETKGCYTGQEIIARQITYDKVARHLRGLLLDRLPPAGETRVEAGGKTVGTLATVVDSLGLHRPIALAYVKRDFAEPGTELTVVAGEEPIAATVARFPLVD